MSENDRLLAPHGPQGPGLAAEAHGTLFSTMTRPRPGDGVVVKVKKRRAVGAAATEPADATPGAGGTPAQKTPRVFVLAAPAAASAALPAAAGAGPETAPPAEPPARRNRRPRDPNRAPGQARVEVFATPERTPAFEGFMPPADGGRVGYEEVARGLAQLRATVSQSKAARRLRF